MPQIRSLPEWFLFRQGHSEFSSLHRLLLGSAYSYICTISHKLRSNIQQWKEKCKENGNRYRDNLIIHNSKTTYVHCKIGKTWCKDCLPGIFEEYHWLQEMATWNMQKTSQFHIVHSVVCNSVIKNIISEPEKLQQQQQAHIHAGTQQLSHNQIPRRYQFYCVTAVKITKVTSVIMIIWQMNFGKPVPCTVLFPSVLAESLGTMAEIVMQKWAWHTVLQEISKQLCHPTSMPVGKAVLTV